jgi:uncharacterized protein YndB with AHSA1/START domain
MAALNETMSEKTDREIIITRVIDAPRELVFEAWSDPKHLDKWWGPNGFTTTTHAFEFKVGGAWQFTMSGPYGDFPNTIVYDEIVAPERIAYTNVGAFTSVATFVEQDGKTTVKMHATFYSPEGLKEAVEHYKAIEGGKQTLERLDAYVSKKN